MNLLANPPFNHSESALRGSAIQKSEGTPQVASEARDNMAGFLLANGPDVSGSSNQSGSPFRPPTSALRLFHHLPPVTLNDAIERLYALKVDTTTRDNDGTPHQKPHKPLLLLAARGWSVALQAVPGASCSGFQMASRRPIISRGTKHCATALPRASNSSAN